LSAQAQGPVASVQLSAHPASRGPVPPSPPSPVAPMASADASRAREEIDATLRSLPPDAASPRTSAANRPSPASLLSMVNTVNSTQNNVFGGQPDSAVTIQALLSANLPPDVLHSLLRKLAPAAAASAHPDEWRAVSKGTSPLSRFPQIDPKRRNATPTMLTVESWDTIASRKIRVSFCAYSAVTPHEVPHHLFSSLAEDWSRGLLQLNDRLQRITPPADSALTPQVPVDTSSFLDMLRHCLDDFPLVNVLNAWEEGHHFVVYEHVMGRSKPQWSSLSTFPFFWSKLSATTTTASGSKPSAANDICLNWNNGTAKRCNPTPHPDCKHRHVCLRCGGDHRQKDCKLSSG
jgi:hypothetical protein